MLRRRCRLTNRQKREKRKMDKQLVIRPMEQGDIECVSRIEAECFSMPWSAAAYGKALEDDKCLYLVAILDDTIVGMCGVMNILGEGDINNVAVTASERGQGIAFAMLSELIRRGEKLGIVDYTLEVRVSNQAAIHTYEKLGFVSEGIRPKFYEKPEEDAMIMWRRRR